MTDVLVAGLVKTYGPKRVVDEVSFACPAGCITAFVGPNGSGKSSTMRMMVNLYIPTAGQTLFGGVEYRDLAHPTHAVGVLLDASAQHPGRSVRTTLRLAARSAQVADEQVDRLIDQFGLATVATRLVKKLSLGMRQRLGLAVALLGEPRVLILDEPMNGLDVESIRWMRDFMRAFADEGGTVLVSSHQLTELQAVADRVVVISRGRIVSEDSMSSLQAMELCEVVVEDTAALVRALQALEIPSKDLGGGRLRVHASARQVGLVARDAGVALCELAPGGDHLLEQHYLGLTSGEFTVNHQASAQAPAQVTS